MCVCVRAHACVHVCRIFVLPIMVCLIECLRYLNKVNKEEKPSILYTLMLFIVPHSKILLQENRRLPVYFKSATDDQTVI